MTSQESLNAYRARQATLESRVRDALERFFYRLDLTDAKAAQIALEQFVPQLVERYGAVSAQLAVEWYGEQVASTGGSFKARPAQKVIAAERIRRGVHTATDALWGGDPAAAAAALMASAGRWVRQYGRDTVTSNAEREGVRWARVPSGPVTCAFCLMTASRDAVYLSQSSALFDHADGSKYHNDCDCEAVRIASDADYPSGYLPDEAFAMYRAATDAVGNRMDTKAITAEMRRLYPDALTDGVHAR